MAKKSKKSAPAPVQGESFFSEGQSAPTANAINGGTTGPATEAGPTVLKRKRAYKARAKTAAVKSGMSHQDAYQQGFKAGVKFAKMGA